MVFYRKGYEMFTFIAGNAVGFTNAHLNRAYTFGTLEEAETHRAALANRGVSVTGIAAV